jgi:starch synthase
MKILFAASEFAGFAEAGGLGDVSAGLPRALQRRDIDVRVLLPAYAEVIAKASDINVMAHLSGLRASGDRGRSARAAEALISRPSAWRSLP